MEAEPLSPELLEILFEFLCDNSGSGDASYGLEIEFFERNELPRVFGGVLLSGFEYQFCSFGTCVVHHDFPELMDLIPWKDESFLRSVQIQLRNFVRARVGKPPLTEEEVEAHFADQTQGLGFSNWKKNRPAGYASGNPQYHPTRDELHAAANYMLKQYPEMVEYIVGLDRWRDQQGYSPLDVYGSALPYHCARDCLAAVLPPMQNYSDYTGGYDVVALVGVAAGDAG